MKLSKLFLLSAIAVASGSVAAKEFQVKVNFKKDDIALEATDSKAMSFPELTANQGTADEATCSLNEPNTGSTQDSLCSNKTGTKATIDITGAAFANVSVTHSANETISGLTFKTNKNGTPVNQSLTLDDSGKGQFIAGGMIVMEDKTAVVTQEYTFTYNIELAYQ